MCARKPGGARHGRAGHPSPPDHPTCLNVKSTYDSVRFQQTLSDTTRPTHPTETNGRPPLRTPRTRLFCSQSGRRTTVHAATPPKDHEGNPAGRTPAAATLRGATARKEGPPTHPRTQPQPREGREPRAGREKIHTTRNCLRPVFIFWVFFSGFFLGLFWRFSNDKNRQLAWSQTSISIGLFLAISIPLIITISGKYGHVNFSTSGAIAHAIVGPGNEQPAPHPFGNTVYKPESGRVTAWEDPSEMQYEYWSPFESNENFFYQLYLIYRNAKTVFKFFSAFDGLGLFLGWFGIGTFVFGLAFFCKKPRAKTWFNERWRWLNIPVICLGAIYLPVYVLSTDQRYFYFILPLF